MYGGGYGGGYPPRGPPMGYGAPPPMMGGGGFGGPPMGYGAPPMGGFGGPPPMGGPGGFQQQRPPGPQGALGEVKSLWVGEVQADWTEEYVRSIYADCGKRFNVKIMRDRATGASQGYGFLEFESHAVAEEVMNLYKDKPIPGTPFKCVLRWGGGHGQAAPANSTWRPGQSQAHQPAGYTGPPVATDFSIFVGDLDYNVTEEQLHKAFAKRYPSILSTKLVIDMSTGLSKGFAFIKFTTERDRDKSMQEMHGQYIGERAIRCTLATTREEREREQKMRSDQQFYDPSRLHAPRATEEGENTCVFVGGLDESVSPDMLRHHFGLLGDIAYIRIPPGRGCGFVGFVHRKNAEAAISTLQGLRINGYKVRLSWGSMRQGPKNARVAQQAAAARAAHASGKPLSREAQALLAQQGGVVPLVTQAKKVHKTPFGSLTNDYMEKLPDPTRPWPPARGPAAPEAPKAAAPAKRLAAAVPMSPYVAQLKARYDAYNAAGGATKAEEAADVNDKRAPGSILSYSSRRAERPAKAMRMDEDDVGAENALYSRHFIKPTMHTLCPAVLAVPRPAPMVAPGDHTADTPMATFLKASG